MLIRLFIFHHILPDLKSNYTEDKYIQCSEWNNGGNPQNCSQIQHLNYFLALQTSFYSLALNIWLQMKMLLQRRKQWMKFLVIVHSVLYTDINPPHTRPPPPPLSACYSSTVTSGRRGAARGSCPPRRVLLLKQDGCARRRSSGGELRQCRGGRRGGRGIYSCVSCPAERATAPQRNGRGLLKWCGLVSVSN